MYYYGKNTIKGLLDSKTMLEKVYLVKNFNDKKILNLLKKNNCKTEYVADSKLNELSEYKNHQGIVAKVFSYQYTDLNEILNTSKNNDNSLVIILDGLEDPQNFGSIIRTGEALGIDGIIIPKNRSVKVTPTVAKVSTGALNSVSISQVTNINQTIKKLKDNHYWIVEI